MKNLAKNKNRNSQNNNANQQAQSSIQGSGNQYHESHTTNAIGYGENNDLARQNSTEN